MESTSRAAAAAASGAKPVRPARLRVHMAAASTLDRVLVEMEPGRCPAEDWPMLVAFGLAAITPWCCFGCSDADVLPN